MTGCRLAEADEVRRALGGEGRPSGGAGLVRAAGAGRAATRSRWPSGPGTVLEAFGSFGFCKAHAAAFALPTYQSAWLKAHHPAAFFAGVLTHDPGMYPKRLILDDARHFGIRVLRPRRQRLRRHLPGRARSSPPDELESRTSGGSGRPRPEWMPASMRGRRRATASGSRSPT